MIKFYYVFRLDYSDVLLVILHPIVLGITLRKKYLKDQHDKMNCDSQKIDPNQMFIKMKK